MKKDYIDTIVSINNEEWRVAEKRMKYGREWFNTLSRENIDGTYKRLSLNEDALKSIIESGELGDIRYIYSQRLNLGRIRDDVDALWNFAPHDISIIQYWLNEPEPIKIDKIGMDYVQKGIDDIIFMNITYPNNIMAHIHVSWLDPHKIRKMTVVGSKKMVVYDDIAENKVMIYDKGIDRMAVLGEQMDFDNPVTFSFNHRSGEVFIPVIDWVEPLKIEIDHFLKCIQNNIPCITGPEHAEKVVRILEMAE